MPEDVHLTSSALLLAAIAVATVIAGLRRIIPPVRKLSRFLDAWEGSTDARGHAVPGVLERLAGVEDTASAVASALGAVNKLVEHLGSQLEELDRKVGSLGELAEEQARLRQALEDLKRITGTDATTPTPPSSGGTS